MSLNGSRILVIDLNNFARYPTISVGLITSILRQEGFNVDVFSPLSSGVNGVVREKPVPMWGLAMEKMKFRSAMTDHGLLLRLRKWLTTTSLHAPQLARQTSKVLSEISTRLRRGNYDAVLVSSYLIYHNLCEQIGELCQSLQVPMLIGGPYFAQPEVRSEWLGIKGLSALVGGEVDPFLAELVRTLIDKEPLDRFPGVWSDASDAPNAPPLQDLDAIPFPDFSDFPWEAYPNRIVPIATGRGCQWGACTFCSDVTGTAGRSYRSRSPQNVLDELSYQSERFGTKLFVFTDPKLNSNLDVWDALLNQLPDRLPGAQWIGAVHIGATRERNGLTSRELDAARHAGMVRLTTGLESGSQRMLDRMQKGAKLSGSSQAIQDASAAGISVRVTMIVGYPGEDADDVHRTAEFLEEHSGMIERVMVNRFHIRTGTRFHRQYEQTPDRFPEISDIRNLHQIAVVEHDFGQRSRAYRKAIDRVLLAAHRINRRPIRESAREFDGVM